MKRKILFWICLISILSIFTVANWIICGHHRWWFNTLDYKIDVTPADHKSNVVVSVSFIGDDYHGKGEIKVTDILVENKPIEWKIWFDGQSRFNMGERYKLDSFYSHILIPFEEAIKGKPLQITGSVVYTHPFSKETDYHHFEISDTVRKRENVWVFGRQKFKIK
jgi:hypothetical protein